MGTTRKKRTSTPKDSAAALTPYPDDLAYLQDEFMWIEARAQRVGAKLMLARGEDGLTTSPRRVTLEDLDISPSRLKQRERRAAAQEDELRRRIDERLKLHRESGRALAADRICARAGLDEFERTVLLLAAAPCISRKFDGHYGELDRMEMASTLTVEVAFSFAEMSFSERVERRTTFSPRGPLVAADLVKIDMGGRFSGPKDLLDSEIEITGRTLKYLLGDPSLDDDFQEFSSVERPRVKLEQVVLSEDDKRRILSVVERHDKYLECRKEWGFDDIISYGRGALMLFYGKPGTGKTMTAHAIAHHIGQRVLNVDIPTLAEHCDALRFLPGLFREARLQNALLFFDECEMLFSSRRNGNALMTPLLTELERFEGVAVMATNPPEVLDEALDRRILVKVRFRPPDRQARREIWQKHLPPTAPLGDDVDLDTLADRYDMTGGYIKNAVLMAVADAVHANGERPEITMASLDRAAHAQLERVDDTENELVSSRVRLSDVVLPTALKSLVEELIAAARSRRTVLERWGVGAHLTYGKGVSALLYGAPGTGKTLTAEAVAGELNRPLLVASIPAIVSMWVGQTEQNLAKTFATARSRGAVLFLDEADSLLMERGEGRASRHDDSAVNTLLKLIERHDGVVLLATNLPDRLDRALERRLTYKLRFPFPGAMERARIWERLVPAGAPSDGTIDTVALGKEFTLSGGHIKNAVFKAAFRAASAGEPLSQKRLMAAAREEQSAKDERNGARPLGFTNVVSEQH